MPYTDADMRRKRQREAKRVARVPVVAATTRQREEFSERFLTWFRYAVDSLPAGGAPWSARLVEAMNAESENDGYGPEYDAYLRRLYNGDVKVPRPQMVFAIGLGLRSAAVSSASGIAALLSAGYIAEAFRILDRAIDKSQSNRLWVILAVLRESLKSLAAASTRLPSRIIMFSNEADDVCDDGVREVR